jgi:glycosylphosphatidylinositol deacylase
MRRRSTGSAAEEEGDDSVVPPANVAGLISPFAAAGASSKVEQSTRDSRNIRSTARQIISENTHELDRRKSTDQRPSTARSRRPSNTNWKPAEARNGQLDYRKGATETSLISVPSEDIAADKMADARQHARRSRPRSPWSCSLLTFVTTALALVALGSIIHSFSNRQLDTKGCRMSYMRPSFAKLSDFDTEHTRFASKYSVYLYREGMVDEDTKVWCNPVETSMVLTICP